MEHTNRGKAGRDQQDGGEYGLKPHLVSTRHYRDDPEFEKKFKDVVVLYLNPPEKAIMLCVEEKSPIPGLERTESIVSIIRNVPERQRIDYERQGTTTWFAALDGLSENGIGECKARHGVWGFSQGSRDGLSKGPNTAYNSR